jgi:DNA-directed RNA polymerase subunit M/transcription elongation factor TFIIS
MEQLVTADQYAQLASLTYQGSNKLILDSGLIITNEIISLLEHYDFETVYEYLLSRTTPDDVILGQLVTEQQRNIDQISAVRRDIKASKFLGRCNNCHGETLISMQMQTRSADEGETTFIVCIACGNTDRRG